MQNHSIAGRKKRPAGFTLVELMVATAIGSSVVVVTVAVASQQRAFHEAHRQISDAQQNTSYLIDTVSRDLRMAGYGLDFKSSELDQWVTWVSDFTSNPKIIQGAGDLPDKLFIAAAFNAPLAEVATGITTGATSVTVNYTGIGSAPFNTTENRILYLGKSETVRITSVTPSGGNLIVLGISTDPNLVEGVHFEYPAGTPIEAVSVVAYEWSNGENGTGYPYISRKDSSDQNFLGGLWEVSSENIEDFQVTEVDNTFTVQATGITAKGRKDSQHASNGDHRYRRSYQGRVRPRN